jgi:tetratricopeptide (TPR) repeat protein
LQASVNPDEYLPKLAVSLTGLGFRLAELDRSDEALTATREAVNLYRELTTARTDQPTLAGSPSSLESESAGAGTACVPVPTSPEENSIYQALQQAKRLYRELALANPEWDRPDLALSLIGLGAEFSELGRPADALSAVQEAVRIYEELAEANPHWYQPNLALAQTILGDRCSELGRPADALSAMQEAVCLYRKLAVTKPERYRPNLAASLNSLGFKFSDLNRPEEALKATREAFNLYREHSAVGPVTHPGSTSFDLNNAETLTAAQDAVQLYRALAAVNPNQYRPALARSLDNLESRLLEVHRPNDARLIQQEAAGLYTELAGQTPKGQNPDQSVRCDIGRTHDGS